jgi:hypothetical protein
VPLFLFVRHGVTLTWLTPACPPATHLSPDAVICSTQPHLETNDCARGLRFGKSRRNESRVSIAKVNRAAESKPSSDHLPRGLDRSLGCRAAYGASKGHRSACDSWDRRCSDHPWPISDASRTAMRLALTTLGSMALTVVFLSFAVPANGPAQVVLLVLGVISLALGIFSFYLRRVRRRRENVPPPRDWTAARRRGRTRN